MAGVRFRFVCDGRSLATFDDVTLAVHRAKKQANRLRAAARNAGERERIDRYVDQCNRIWAVAFGLESMKEKDDGRFRKGGTAAGDPIPAPLQCGGAGRCVTGDSTGDPAYRGGSTSAIFYSASQPR